MAKAIDQFVQYILDQLAPIGPVRARSMFGGWMLSLDDNGLGMVNDGILYLKVDDETRPTFTEAGGEPFGYTHKAKGTVYMHGYSTIPESDIDDRHALLGWARLAVGASRRAAAGTKQKAAKKAPAKKPAKKAATKKAATKKPATKKAPATMTTKKKATKKTVTKKQATKKKVTTRKTTARRTKATTAVRR